MVSICGSVEGEGMRVCWEQRFRRSLLGERSILNTACNAGRSLSNGVLVDLPERPLEAERSQGRRILSIASFLHYCAP